MSNQEAIALLRNLEDSLDSYCELSEEGKTAFRMAVEALNSSEFPNNSDVVDRQKAKNAICNACGKIDCDEMDTCEKLDIPSEGSKLLQPWEVLVAQAVLPQPKRGKWIEDKGQQTLMQNFIERGEVWRVCSVCGAGHMIGHKYECDKAYHETHHNFCPNCGAKMEVTT